MQPPVSSSVNPIVVHLTHFLKCFMLASGGKPPMIRTAFVVHRGYFVLTFYPVEEQPVPFENFIKI